MICISTPKVLSRKTRATRENAPLSLSPSDPQIRQKANPGRNDPRPALTDRRGGRPAPACPPERPPPGHTLSRDLPSRAPLAAPVTRPHHKRFPYIRMGQREREREREETNQDSQQQQQGFRQPTVQPRGGGGGLMLGTRFLSKKVGKPVHRSRSRPRWHFPRFRGMIRLIDENTLRYLGKASTAVVSIAHPLKREELVQGFSLVGS